MDILSNIYLRLAAYFCCSVRLSIDGRVSESQGQSPLDKVRCWSFSRLAVIVVAMALPLLACIPPAHRAAREPAPLRFAVSFADSVHSEPVTGRVLLFLSDSAEGEPRFGPSLSNPQPVFALEVENLAPGEVVEFAQGAFNNPSSLAYPGPMRRIVEGDYVAQVLFDIDTTRPSYGSGPGNLYSEVRSLHIAPKYSGTVSLVATQKVSQDQPPEDTEWVKLVEVRSALMSAFYGREVFLRAGVVLPPGYEENPEALYPAIYVVPGFGGRHTGAWRWIDGEKGQAWQRGEFPSQPMLQIALDPEVPNGHSTFCDSENNGPAGEALLTELIPEIERRFRVISAPYARLLTGHSSGGWASLWLQVRYPDFFGGTWSTAPDPVDFRAFQAINLYEDADAYFTDDGYPRPSMRQDGEVVLSIRDENYIEYVTGAGGQWGSWEAAYSPRMPDGTPARIWDKVTGRIDREVAEAWRPYDIRLRLEENWADLGPRLRGKIHVIVGAHDNFYLERAVRLLKDFLDGTDFGGYVAVPPGDHSSFRTSDTRLQIYEEMAEQFRRNAPTIDGE